jgi:hypothetical protein
LIALLNAHAPLVKIGDIILALCVPTVRYALPCPKSSGIMLSVQSSNARREWGSSYVTDHRDKKQRAKKQVLFHKYLAIADNSSLYVNRSAMNWST